MSIFKRSTKAIRAAASTSDVVIAVSHDVGEYIKSLESPGAAAWEIAVGLAELMAEALRHDNQRLEENMELTMTNAILAVLAKNPRGCTTPQILASVTWATDENDKKKLRATISNLVRTGVVDSEGAKRSRVYKLARRS